MKITHLVCSFPPYYGGMGNSAMHMALVSAKFNHRVSVITPDYGANRKQNLDGFPDLSSLKVIRLKPWFSIGNAALIPQVFFYLWSCDIVHLHYPFYGVATPVLLAKLMRPKLKLIVHYHMDTKAKGLKGLIFKLYRLLMFPIVFEVSDFITCASLDYVKHSQIAAYAHSYANKFTQIPFGVDLTKFHQADKPAKSRELIFVGGLDEAHYFKGVDVLLNAMKLVDNVTSDWHLKIVGRGSLKEKYQKLARDLGVESKVVFVDDANDDSLVKLYQQARCLVLPSINGNEAFGLVLLEAMASARPVIASNLPGVRNVFRNNTDGLVVRPGNVKDLSEKIIRILNHDDLVDQMGLSAREYCEQYYSWDYAGKKLNNLYHRIKFSPKL